VLDIVYNDLFYIGIYELLLAERDNTFVASV
jgi:hypothetical protein